MLTITWRQVRESERTAVKAIGLEGKGNLWVQQESNDDYSRNEVLTGGRNHKLQSASRPEEPRNYQPD